MNAQDVAVAWHGLPAYAARLIKAASGTFPVVATRPAIPIFGMEALLPGRIYWTTDSFSGGWSGLGLEVPKIFFQPAWNTPCFNLLGDEVRRSGGAVVLMFDNRWKGSLRQLIGAVRFRTQWRRRFRSVLVCGSSGVRLAKFWGFRSEVIYTGMYGADPLVFGIARKRLRERSKRVLFVARLVEEKGVRELLDAWKLFSTAKTDWALHIYGEGPLESAVRESKAIFHGFQQPDVVAAAMRDARCLILPSYDEHWGLVACEAAQSGCGLLLSTTVGSAPDLVGKRNGRLFPVTDISQLVDCLRWMSELSVEALDEMEAESRALGARFTPKRWGDTFDAIVAPLL